MSIAIQYLRKKQKPVFILNKNNLNDTLMVQNKIIGYSSIE